MYAHAQRQHVLQSFDLLLKSIIVHSYFIDPYIFRMIVRYLVQMQLLQPRDVESSTSLRVFIASLVFVHAGPVCRHLFQKVEPPAVTDMILLDFIGRIKPASQFLIATLDIAIFFLQILMLVIAHETQHYHPDLPDPLAPTDEPSQSVVEDEEMAALTGAYDKPQPPDPAAGPVLHLRFRPTLRRIARPPPVEPSSDLPGGATTTAARRNPTLSSLLLSTLFRNVAHGRSRPPIRTADEPPSPAASGPGRTLPGSLGRDW